MRSTIILEEFKKNWLINILGFIIFIAAFLTLNINEARHFFHESAMNEAFTEVISMNKANDGFKSPNFEGKLVHLSGLLKIDEGLGDLQYMILVQAVKLKKIVEMYQYHEDFTESNFGDESASKSYYYYKDWSEAVIDSRSFHSMSHQNPSKKPFESKVIVADKVYIGNIEICDEAKEKFNTYIDITADTRPDDSYIKMHSGAYYHTEDLFDLQIGDVRVKFQFAGLEDEEYTIVGKFVKGKIVAATKNKKKILLLSKGKVSIEDMFHQEKATKRKELWFTRIFGFLLIVFAIISTENLGRVAFTRTRLAFLIPDHAKQLRSYIKIAFTLTFTICVIRQSLHYLRIIN